MRWTNEPPWRKSHQNQKSCWDEATRLDCGKRAVGYRKTLGRTEIVVSSVLLEVLMYPRRRVLHDTTKIALSLWDIDILWEFMRGNLFAS